MSQESYSSLAKLRPVSFFKLFQFARGGERYLLVMGGMSLIVAGISLVVNFSMASFLLKEVQEVCSGKKEFSEAKSALLGRTVGTFCIGLFMAGLMYVGLSSYMFAGERIVYRMRKAYMNSVLHMDMAWFDTLGAGEITTRLTSNIDRVRDGVGEKLALLIMDTGIILAVIGNSFFLSVKLAMCVCSLMAICLVGLVVGNVYAQKLATLALGEYAVAGSLAEESIASIRTVHSFNMAGKLAAIYKRLALSAERYSRRRVFIESAAIGMLTFSVYMGVAIDWKVGFAMMEDDKEIIVAVVFIFIALFLSVYSVASIPPNLLAITTARAAAAKIYQVIEIVPAIHHRQAKTLGDIHGRIGFNNITFHFPSHPDVTIFENFNLEVEAGATVALVGASGSGKSTLVQLMERFYDPTHGQVTLDGVDIREFDVKWLRRQFGLVSQEPVLFSGTIFENVALGLIGTTSEKATHEDQARLIEQACKDANAHGFITQLPNGYQTNVGEQGFLLSGGQKQRIAIARAIVKDPKVLLLDEATSALDTKSEAVVQKALDQASQGRTTLVIAHRLSTIQHADAIIVIDRGRIVERGTHAELLALRGPYFSLVNIQTSHPNTCAPSTAAPKLGQAEDYEEETPLLEPLCAEEIRASTFSSVWSLMKLNFPEAIYNTVGVVGAVLLGAMNFILFLALRHSFLNLLELLIKTKKIQESALWDMFLLLSGIAVLAGILQVCCILGLGIAAEKLGSRLRVLLIEAVLRQEVGWFDLDSNSVGVLVSSVAFLPQRITAFSGTSLGAFINIGVNLGISIGIGCWLDVKMSLVMLVFLPLLVGLGMASLYLMSRFSKQSKQAFVESTRMACENASQMRTVASLTTERQVFEKYQASQRMALKAGYLNAFVTTICLSLSASVVPIVISMATFLLAMFASEIDLAERQEFFLKASGVIFLFIMVASDAFRKLPLLVGVKAAKDSAKHFNLMQLREPRINQLADGPGKHVDSSSGEIAFSNVHFSYPTRLNTPSLRGISFQAKQGQRIALVGPSGSGKSTSVGLIERFYDISRGSITLDGVDIRDLHLPSYRDLIALVGQEPALFNLSIKDNILMGARTCGSPPDMGHVVAAAKASNIHDFIMSLPDEYETMVGGKGSQLSGGQKQRIAIARALIRNPQILLLDEATSALDAESETVVQATLDKASQGRTTIAIAHRLSTIQNADLILVMKDGIIIERGTHLDLLARNGLYAEMASQQSLT